MGSTISDITAHSMYNYEHGSYTYVGSYLKIWLGKIAWAYPSDFALATNGGSLSEKNNCLNRTINN